MVINNQAVSIDLIPENIRNIESFVDTVCDQLFINDTYYGNILMSVTELFNYLVENNHEKTVNISYHSDYNTFGIAFQHIDNQIIESFINKIDLDNILDKDKNLFLIQLLANNIVQLDSKTLSLEFDISALHNEIYQQRSSLLKKYFSKQTSKQKVKNHND